LRNRCYAEISQNLFCFYTASVASRHLTRAIKALSSDKRLKILHWLKDPEAHFRRQVDGDLIKDGVCGVLIAQKLGVSQPTASQHLKLLAHAGLVRAKRIKQWTFYRRDEARIRQIKRAILAQV
jgi:DNA-binding transcriptional ArsR family regulator